MIDLRKYVVGGKLANTEDLIMENTAMDKQEENYIILLIPQSVWDRLKQEMPIGG